MTREEVKAILPILQAYADGKIIQYKGGSEDITDLAIGNFERNAKNYSIKPSPTYRPFANADECWQEMQKHQPVGWVEKKDTKSKEFINMISFNTESYPVHIDNIHYPFSDMLFTDYTFADGSVFGVKEESEE